MCKLPVLCLFSEGSHTAHSPPGSKMQPHKQYFCSVKPVRDELPQVFMGTGHIGILSLPATKIPQSRKEAHVHRKSLC